MKIARVPGIGVRVPAFDGVRGLAVLAVILFHAWVLTSAGSGLDRLLDRFIGTGWLGVDLFFVLSGFLITGILLDSKGAPGYFRNFYARRTLRIFPLFYGVVFAAAIVLPALARVMGSQHAQLTDVADQFWDSQLWLWTYTHNFLQATQPHTLPGLGHFWTLAVEEQFYLVWPLVVLLVPNRRLVQVISGVCLGVTVLRVVLANSGVDPWAIRHWTFTRIDTLLLGALAAVVVRNPELWARVRKVVPLLLVAGTATLVISSIVRGPLVLDSVFSATLVYPVAAVAFAALMVRLCDTGGNHFLEAGWLRRIGQYSYAMYVFHWPINIALSAVWSRSGIDTRLGRTGSGLPLFVLQFALVAGASFCAAAISWHLWESKWLALKQRFAYATRVSPADVE